MFDYHRPTSIEEALSIKNAAPSSRFIAGATDLWVQMRNGKVAKPPALISLRRIDVLTKIEVGDTLRIGSAALLSDIARHPEVERRHPALFEAIEQLGSPQIRNAATLGGNLCNASPAADTAPPLLIFEAEVELRSPRGIRTLPLDNFFTGPGATAMKSDELLTAVLLPMPAAAARSLFLRKSRVRMDLATVNVAMLLQTDGDRCSKARVAVGAVAPTPLRLPEVEQIIERGPLDASIEEPLAAATTAAIRPISDLRASAGYRTHLTAVLVKRALFDLIDARPPQPRGNQ